MSCWHTNRYIFSTLSFSLSLVILSGRYPARREEGNRCQRSYGLLVRRYSFLSSLNGILGYHAHVFVSYSAKMTFGLAGVFSFFFYILLEFVDSVDVAEMFRDGVDL